MKILFLKILKYLNIRIKNKKNINMLDEHPQYRIDKYGLKDW